MNWKRRERDLHSELRAHLEMAANDARARGETADAARLAALREFGDRDELLAIAAAFFAVVAGIAGFIPARRASRLDPIAALREE